MATDQVKVLERGVGFMPSNFRNRRAPTRSEILVASIREPLAYRGYGIVGYLGQPPAVPPITPCLDTCV